MNKEIVRNIKLGIFMIAGVLLLVTGLYFIGNNRNMFGKTYKLYAIFTNVGGLQTGNNVRYAGINVGTVNDVRIVNDTTIRVEMLIGADLKTVIRKSAIASIGTDGLMGSKLINIGPGEPNSPLAQGGDELAILPSINMDAMLRTLQRTNENIAVVSANLRDITDNINNGRGTLYTVLMDTTLAHKIHKTVDNITLVSNNILQISNDLGDVTSSVKSGKGMLGTLIKDTVITADLAKAVKEVKSASEQINASTADLKELLQKINGGAGTVGTLINDTVSANHLKKSLENIENSSRNFNQNMEALKHNFLLRGYFKKQEKKKATGHGNE